ncbi:MAG: outer membrane beta-barrel protein [Bacteroidia bacterium]|nr:outer membrane beta-barrel protein [Bacteroidia bacterium]
MKKLVLLVALAVNVNAFCQADNTWQLGLQWGAHSSHTQLSGGMTEANARFGNEDAGGGAFSLQFRYDFNKRWMISSGFGFQSFGFRYSLAQNYSLLNPESRSQGVSTEFAGLEFPVMWHFKFNPNCKNTKWVLGAGWVQGLIGSQNTSKTFTEGSESNANANFISCQSTVNDGYYAMVRFSIARERVFKKGGIFNAALMFNAGLRELATAKVNYRVDGKSYNHEFKNNGNFVGIRLTYFFRPISTLQNK